LPKKRSGDEKNERRAEEICEQIIPYLETVKSLMQIASRRYPTLVPVVSVLESVVDNVKNYFDQEERDVARLERALEKLEQFSPGLSPEEAAELVDSIKSELQPEETEEEAEE